jgi:toxin ParE1/3/4
MIKFIVSEKALVDLNEIWKYTADYWSIDQANRYFNQIIDEIEFISNNFAQAKDFGDVRNGYRFSKVGSHLLFFRSTTSDEIEVVRILHERMDIKNRLVD